jgi:two-component system, cell cycle response regulator
MNMSDSVSDKTSIVSSDTFRGKMRAADEVPPAIVILVGPPGYVGKQWLINKNEIVIGRSNEVEVSVSDNSLSRSHAKFVLSGMDVLIIDMGSTNKTIVNNQPLPPMVPRKLVNNDQIKTGNVIFKFLEKGNVESLSNQHIFDKAQKDALTGAFNKGALLEKGPELVRRAEVLSEPLAVITYDIDFFKKINDGHGHPGGDYVLKELGHLMRLKLVRSNDYFSRYGGEEFVLILQATTLKTAMEVAERIRQTIELHTFTFEDKKVPVTISLGVSIRKGADTWESLYDRADKALYLSKQNGRNKVTAGDVE